MILFERKPLWRGTGTYLIYRWWNFWDPLWTRTQLFRLCIQCFFYCAKPSTGVSGWLSAGGFRMAVTTHQGGWQEGPSTLPPTPGHSHRERLKAAEQVTGPHSSPGRTSRTRLLKPMVTVNIYLSFRAVVSSSKDLLSSFLSWLGDISVQTLLPLRALSLSTQPGSLCSVSSHVWESHLVWAAKQWWQSVTQRAVRA